MKAELRSLQPFVRLFENTMKHAAVFYMVSSHVLQSTFYLRRGLRWGLNARRHVVTVVVR